MSPLVIPPPSGLRRLRVLEQWPGEAPVAIDYLWTGDRWAVPLDELIHGWGSKTLLPGDPVLDRHPTPTELLRAYERDEGLFIKWEWLG